MTPLSPPTNSEALTSSRGLHNDWDFSDCRDVGDVWGFEECGEFEVGILGPWRISGMFGAAREL